MRFTHGPGDRPLDGYTIQQGLGRGGFGEVYQAISDGGKIVALKLVQRNLEVELRGVSQCLNLKHSNLVAVYDVKQAENGDQWIVMEFVNGETLDKAIARHPRGMPVEELLVWLKGIGEGVAYLHEHGIVHRDLKPGNLFLENLSPAPPSSDRQGGVGGEIVKIGDYGLSKFMTASRRSGQTTSIGTVHYMAPEVVKGRYGKEVDLYAIGVILYEMLTGRVPFTGESPGEILMKHLTTVPEVSMLPPAFQPVVRRLLDKDPGRRYSSVHAMLADLMGYLSSPPQPSVESGAEPAFVETPRAGPIREALQLFASLPPPSPRPTSVARPIAEAGAPVWVRLFLSLCLGLGVGLFIGGICAYNRCEEEVCFLIGFGAGLVLFTLVAGRVVRPNPSLAIRLILGLARGVGGALFLAGILAHNRFPDEAAALISIGAGLILIGLTLYRWLKRRPAEQHAPAAPETPSLAATPTSGVPVSGPGSINPNTPVDPESRHAIHLCTRRQAPGRLHHPARPRPRRLRRGLPGRLGRRQAGRP